MTHFFHFEPNKTFSLEIKNRHVHPLLNVIHQMQYQKNFIDIFRKKFKTDYFGSKITNCPHFEIIQVFLENLKLSLLPVF